MKRLLNYLKPLRFGLWTMMMGAGVTASAQTWCGATHQWGCDGGGGAGNWYAAVGHVEVVQDGKTLYRKGPDGCQTSTGAGTQTSVMMMNAGKPFDMTAG
ncbi:MAG: hypothetical protein ACK5XN_33895, partial [Bacteroidota bacterium]